MNGATLYQRSKMVQIGIELFRSWQCGCHQGWYYTEDYPDKFEVLTEEGLVDFEVRDSNTLFPFGWRLTPRGLHALTKLQDALTEGLR